MSTHTGYTGHTLDELLELVEAAMPANEGFWLAMELKNRFENVVSLTGFEWDKAERKWVPAT